MSETKNHPWCRDVRRDEAVRAAEDAAEAERTPLPDHRDMPQAVAELRGRVARLEAANTNHDAPPGARVSERECAAHADTGADTAGNGLRTERVTPDWQRAKWDEALAIICDGGDWGRGNNFDHGIIGALVIWADKEISRLTAERDEAKEECERLRGSLAACDVIANSNTTKSLSVNRCILPEYDCPAVQCVIAAVEREISLRARVAELEAAAAPAANAGGEANQPWPMAFAVWGRGAVCGVTVSREDAGAMQREFPFDTEVMPLYAAPQPPRGWLTSEEREAIRYVSATHGSWSNDDQPLKVVESLLARSMPPRVRRPKRDYPPMPGGVVHTRDKEWIAAIREAGGEVEE